MKGIIGVMEKEGGTSPLRKVNGKAGVNEQEKD